MRCKWPWEPSDPKDRGRKKQTKCVFLVTIMGITSPANLQLYIEIRWFNGCFPNLQLYIYRERERKKIDGLNVCFAVFTPWFLPKPPKKHPNQLHRRIPSAGIPYIHRSCVLMTRQAVEHGFFRTITWICFEYLVPQTSPMKIHAP